MDRNCRTPLLTVAAVRQVRLSESDRHAAITPAPASDNARRTKGDASGGLYILHCYGAAGTMRPKFDVGSLLQDKEDAPTRESRERGLRRWRVRPGESSPAFDIPFTYFLGRDKRRFPGSRDMNEKY